MMRRRIESHHPRHPPNAYRIPGKVLSLVALLLLLTYPMFLVLMLLTGEEIHIHQKNQVIQMEPSSGANTNFISSPSSISSTNNNNKKPKNLMVIDCFPYNGEHIVAARLAILNPHVDLFFISEFPFTHSGNKKHRLFKDINAHVFEPYQDKIIWIDTEKVENENSAWTRENMQRNAGVASIQNAMEEGKVTQPFVVINTDADEIPNPNVIQQIMPEQELHEQIQKGPIFLNMTMFYFNLNWIKGGSWLLPSLVHSKHLLEQHLSLQVIRDSRTHRIRVNDGGWHCSFFMSTQNIIHKLESFAHQEYNKEPYTSREYIEDCIVNGKDLFGRGSKDQYRLNKASSFLNVEDHLPEQLLEFSKVLVSSQINDEKKKLQMILG